MKFIIVIGPKDGAYLAMVEHQPQTTVGGYSESEVVAKIVKAQGETLGLKDTITTEAVDGGFIAKITGYAVTATGTSEEEVIAKIITNYGESHLDVGILRKPE